jgi:hydrogenase maturation protease
VIKILVLGIGNTLLGDEGAGVHAIRRLQECLVESEGVELLDGGTLGFMLAGPIAEADGMIVIDAAQLNSLPGTVALFQGPEMERFLAGPKRSVHEVSLIDLLTAAQLTDSLPARRALVGIQPASLDWSETLSEPVARAVPLACEMVAGLIAEWHTTPHELQPVVDRSPSGHTTPGETRRNSLGGA